MVGVFGIFVSSSVVLKICALIEGIKKYNPSSKKKKETWQYGVVSKNWLYIKHEEFFLVNNLLRKYNKMNEEIKNPENAAEYTI